MGEERDATTEPCMCGAGTFLIEAFSPDHSWGGATRYEAHIQCESCARDYVIKGNGVVRRGDYQGCSVLDTLTTGSRFP